MKISKKIRKIIYGQLKCTFDAHPEYLKEGIDIASVCESATKRIFGEIEHLSKNLNK